MDEDWKSAWDPGRARIGEPFPLFQLPGDYAIDAVEAGAIRKYLEPLEFDCPLHYDEDVARHHGYPGIIAPYTSMLTFTLLAMWRPGTQLFTSDSPDAQPEKTAIKPNLPDYFPKFTSYFSTDMEFEFFRPVVVGETIWREPGLLIDCEPKETSVGRGAFIKADCRIVNQSGELIARQFFGSYYYNPFTEEGA